MTEQLNQKLDDLSQKMAILIDMLQDLQSRADGLADAADGIIGRLDRVESDLADIWTSTVPAQADQVLVVDDQADPNSGAPK